ncbi:hypothetical protein Hanom_Chr04g00352781 [Helianthus anomalus]
MSSSRQLSSSKKSKVCSQKKMMAFMAKQFTRIIRKIVTEIQASNTPNSCIDPKVVQHKPVTFNYKHFASCNPKPFIGKDGVTAMLEWFDSIEVTFINNECVTTPDPYSRERAAANQLWWYHVIILFGSGNFHQDRS